MWANNCISFICTGSYPSFPLSSSLPTPHTSFSLPNPSMQIAVDGEGIRPWLYLSWLIDSWNQESFKIMRRLYLKTAYLEQCLQQGQWICHRCNRLKPEAHNHPPSTHVMNACETVHLVVHIMTACKLCTW